MRTAPGRNRWYGRAPDFVWQPSDLVPLISSPNLLAPDRTAMDVLERAGRRYDIAFTAST